MRYDFDEFLKVLSVDIENGYLKWDKRNLGFGYIGSHIAHRLYPGILMLDR